MLNLNQIRHIFRIQHTMRFSYLFVFLAIFCCSNSYSQVKNEDDLKKQAEKNFEDEEYNEAYKQYAQLVSLYPKDPEYNYRLGVCMLFTEPDKKKPYSYFQIALKNPEQAPKDAKFYLAKTYHVNYKFDEALKLYNEYKKTAPAASAKKLQVDREIQACINGKRLLSNLSDLVIINKKQLAEADYFRSYDLKDIGGKLLVKSPEFQTGLDKRKKDKSVIYLPRSGERIYYSSYGDNGDRGRDIYYVNRLPNGSWSKPTLLPAPINTEYDEDYPFVHPNGKTLYFSSKGHNSMGGYDVFKTTFDDATNTWSKPVNLDFPINSPDDDILFVTDSLEKTAFFSTGRYSPYGKIDVLKINTERRPMNFAVLKGTVVKEEASQSLKSKITVKNMANGEIVGTYQAQDNGDYYMELPNGGKFIFTVETPGIPTQSDGVQIPVAYNLKPYKQVISYDKKVLRIINYFDGQVADENYAMMIDLIEKKAKLEINESDPYNNSLKDAAIKNQNATAGNNGNDLNSVTTTNPTVTNEQGNQKNNPTNTNKNVTNEQLLNMAKDDAKEAGEESTKLKQEAQDAFGLATQKTAEALDMQKQADEAITAANSITDVAKKNEELSKANQLKEDATIASNVANTATNLAKKLEVDANQKQKEADLTNQYIKQLEEVIKNKNNKEALAKLEQIQKDLDDLSKQKNQSDELLNSLKAEAELKQKELIASEKKNQGILNEIKAIKGESEGLEKDMMAENDKALKENIAAQIRELANEIELKNKELATNNQKIETLSNEVEGVNKELEIASKILNETGTAGVAITNENNNVNNNQGAAISANNNTNGNNIPSLSIEGLNKKYSDQLASAAIDNTTKEGITKQTAILKTYNKETTDLIALDKNALSKTTDAKEKQLLNTEIRNLEKLKTDNEKIIAANNTKVKQLESNAIAANNTNGNAENGNAITSNTNNATSSENGTAIDNANNNGSNATNGNKIDNTNSTAVNSNTTAIDNTNSTAANNNTNGNTIDTNNGNSSAANSNTTAITNNTNNGNNTTNNGNAIGNENSTAANSTNSISANTNAANGNENGNSIANNNTNGNENQNTTGITNNNTNSNTNALKTISPNSANDNSAYLNELNSLKNSLNGSSAEANSLFAYINYKENTSLSLKQNATQKFEAAKQNEAALNNLVTKTESAIKAASANNAANLLNEAEALNNKAYEQRKESATKTGSEKDALIAQAIANEKTAVTKKLEASVIQQKQNKDKFDDNAANLAELKTLTGTKTSNEISQANMLMDEAAINFKQAQKIRSETEFYPSDAAKLGGLSNAEEKENEALFKQQKALDLLAKANPGYKPKTTDTSNPALAIENLNNEIAKTSQSQLDAYLALSKANQNELKLQGDKLAANPAVKNGTNAQAKALKTEADNLNKEAKDLIGKSLTASSNAEKANLLLKANDKEIEAIKKLNEAGEALKTSTAVVTNNNNNGNTTTANNNGNENSNGIAANTNPNGNTNAANNNTTTANNNGNENSNGIAANTNPNGNTNAANTNTTAVNTNASENPNAISANNNSANNGNANETNSNNTNPDNANANTTSARTATTSAGNNTENAIASNTASAASTETGTPINIQTDNMTDASASITGNGVGDEASKLKTALTNNKEAGVTEFNAYTNNEAIALKDNALAKIKAALNEDKTINAQLDNVNRLAVSQPTGGVLDQASISSIVSEAEKLNDEAFAKRKAAAAKTGAEKDKDLNDAKALEQQAIAKKVDAAAKQQQLNTATFDANKQSLQDLAEMAKGKNIAELNTAEKEFNDATIAFKQASDLRTEANAYPTDAAKLGGYSNAEEKENQAIAKQQALLDIYKKYFSNYVARQPSIKTDSPEAIAKLNETKTSINANTRQHIEGLTLLAQANEKEYQSRLAATPANLNSSQAGLKTRAQSAYKKNQGLLNQANQTPDAIKKKNLLVDANQSAQDAIALLNQITNPDAVVTNNAGNSNSTANNNTRNNGNNGTAANNTNANNAANTNTANNNNNTNNAGNNNANAVRLKVEGLDIKTTNAYSAAKPIPIDEKMPDGLVFKVQIGAFKAPLPDNTFKGLSPVSAQTTPNGYLRYMAGNFEKYESASAVKNDLRNLGYSDAFVVVYFNGKRITLAEALEKLKAEGKPVDIATNTTAGITTANVPRNPFPVNTTAANVATDAQPVEITRELEQMNGLLFTVQIGVYSKQATRSQLSGLRPIYTEKLPNGLYRYTAGIYNQGSKLLEDKRKVVDLGVKDAFVSAYYNSKRIPFAEGQKLQTENTNLKMEAENPIIFPGSGAVSPANNTTNQPATNTAATNQPTVAAFSNGVTTGPAPTPENGVKTDEAGISFKVQIGAYKNQVPNEVASKFLNIKTWPVNNVVINGLYIYTIGNFTGISFAKKLKDEAISVGITDAFITVYKDGKKLYGAEAARYLSN
jgi:hypothetical protein